MGRQDLLVDFTYDWMLSLKGELICIISFVPYRDKLTGTYFSVHRTKQLMYDPM